MNQADNVERIESDHSLGREHQEWLDSQAKVDEASREHFDKLWDACQAIRAIGVDFTSEDVAQILATLGNNIAHLPTERDLIDVCHGSIGWAE